MRSLLALVLLAVSGTVSDAKAQGTPVVVSYAAGENVKTQQLLPSQLNTPNLTFELRFSAGRVCGVRDGVAAVRRFVSQYPSAQQAAGPLQNIRAYSVAHNGIDTGNLDSIARDFFSTGGFRPFRVFSVLSAVDEAVSADVLIQLKQSNDLARTTWSYSGCLSPAEFRAWRNEAVRILGLYYGIATQ